MISISLFEINDTQKLYDLFREWEKSYHFDYDLFKRTIASNLDHSDYKIIVAKDNKDIIGYAQIGKCYYLGFEPFYEVIQLLVTEKRQEQGIGHEIMKRVEEIALSENIKVIRLSSQIHRLRAHKFYENMGYKLSKTSKFYEKAI